MHITHHFAHCTVRLTICQRNSLITVQLCDNLRYQMLLSYLVKSNTASTFSFSFLLFNHNKPTDLKL